MVRIQSDMLHALKWSMLHSSLTFSLYSLYQLSGEDVASLRQLLSTVTSDLQRSLDLMVEVGADIVAARPQLARAFAMSKAGLDAFTRA